MSNPYLRSRYGNDYNKQQHPIDTPAQQLPPPGTTVLVDVIDDDDHTAPPRQHQQRVGVPQALPMHPSTSFSVSAASSDSDDDMPNASYGWAAFPKSGHITHEVLQVGGGSSTSEKKKEEPTSAGDVDVQHKKTAPASSSPQGFALPYRTASQTREEEAVIATSTMTVNVQDAATAGGVALQDSPSKTKRIIATAEDVGLPTTVVDPTAPAATAAQSLTTIVSPSRSDEATRAVSSASGSDQQLAAGGGSGDVHSMIAALIQRTTQSIDTANEVLLHEHSHNQAAAGGERPANLDFHVGNTTSPTAAAPHSSPPQPSFTKKDQPALLIQEVISKVAEGGGIKTPSASPHQQQQQGSPSSSMSKSLSTMEMRHSPPSPQVAEHVSPPPTKKEEVEDIVQRNDNTDMTTITTASGEKEKVDVNDVPLPPTTTSSSDYFSATQSYFTHGSASTAAPPSSNTTEHEAVSPPPRAVAEPHHQQLQLHQPADEHSPSPQRSIVEQATAAAAEAAASLGLHLKSNTTDSWKEAAVERWVQRHGEHSDSHHNHQVGTEFGGSKKRALSPPGFSAAPGTVEDKKPVVDATDAPMPKPLVSNDDCAAVLAAAIAAVGGGATASGSTAGSSSPTPQRGSAVVSTPTPSASRVSEKDHVVAVETTLSPVPPLQSHATPPQTTTHHNNVFASPSLSTTRSSPQSTYTAVTTTSHGGEHSSISSASVVKPLCRPGELFGPSGHRGLVGASAVLPPHTATTGLRSKAERHLLRRMPRVQENSASATSVAQLQQQQHVLTVLGTSDAQRMAAARGDAATNSGTLEDGTAAEKEERKRANKEEKKKKEKKDKKKSHRHRRDDKKQHQEEEGSNNGHVDATTTGDMVPLSALKALLLNPAFRVLASGSPSAAPDDSPDDDAHKKDNSSTAGAASQFSPSAFKQEAATAYRPVPHANDGTATNTSTTTHSDATATHVTLNHSNSHAKSSSSPPPSRVVVSSSSLPRVGLDNSSSVSKSQKQQQNSFGADATAAEKLLVDDTSCHPPIPPPPPPSAPISLASHPELAPAAATPANTSVMTTTSVATSAKSGAKKKSGGLPHYMLPTESWQHHGDDNVHLHTPLGCEGHHHHHHSNAATNDQSMNSTILGTTPAADLSAGSSAFNSGFNDPAMMVDHTGGKRDAVNKFNRHAREHLKRHATNAQTVSNKHDESTHSNGGGTSRTRSTSGGRHEPHRPSWH